MRRILTTFLFLLGISSVNGQPGIDSLKKEVTILKSKVDSINKLSSDLDQTFKVSIGARFSFFTAEKPTELYYDINGFIPSIWTKSKKKCIKNFGLYASLSENKFEYVTSGDKSEDESQDNSGEKSGTFSIINEPSLVSVINSDSAVLAYNSYYRTITTKNNYQISLSLFPTIKLYDYLYFFGHIEGIFGSSEKEFTDVLIGSDTNHIAIESDSLNMLLNDPKYPFPYTISEGYKLNSINTFVGFGLFLNYETKNILFQVMPSGGFFIDRKSYKTLNGREMNSRNNDYFLACRFTLTERNTGIKIGGNVIRTSKTKSLNYSIYISKQFSISKIADFLKSK